MNNITTAEKKIIKICKKYNVVIDYNIFFPDAPKDKPHHPEIQLAIKTLMRHGMKILFVLKDLEEILSKPVKKTKK